MALQWTWLASFLFPLVVAFRFSLRNSLSCTHCPYGLRGADLRRGVRPLNYLPRVVGSEMDRNQLEAGEMQFQNFCELWGGRQPFVWVHREQGSRSSKRREVPCHHDKERWRDEEGVPGKAERRSGDRMGLSGAVQAWSPNTSVLITYLSQ